MDKLRKGMAELVGGCGCFLAIGLTVAIIMLCYYLLWLLDNGQLLSF